MMQCQIKNCENNAFLAYGPKWICGKCFTKIQEKEKERMNKMMEELE